MHTFTTRGPMPDDRPHTWELAINVTQVKRVKGLVGVDLPKLVEDRARPLGELMGDPCRLVDTLYALCQTQAEALKVSDEDFGRGLTGDALGLAADAFVEELIDFFPDQARRAALRTVLKKGKAVAESAMRKALADVENLDVEREAATLLKLLSSSPALSVLTPDRSPSANSP